MRRLLPAFPLLLLALLLGPAVFAASDLPIHFVDARWATARLPGHGEMTVDITVAREDQGDHFFYAHTIYLNGRVAGSVGPNILYAGIQNRGRNDRGWEGRVAIFSVWGVASGQVEPQGWGTAFAGEGTGYSVRIPYDWRVGRTYRLTVSIVQRGLLENLFEASLTDLATGVRTRIGRIPVPGARGLMVSPVSFHEVYKYDKSSAGKPHATSCTLRSTSVVTFANARADGVKLRPKIHRRDGYDGCPGLTGSRIVNGGVRSWVGQP